MQLPWIWILVILSAIIGPFEAMHALNKARRNREEAEKRRQEAQEKRRQEAQEKRRQEAQETQK